jgi:glycosyltransferase involved in cell wall biosynthesis
MTFMPDSSEHPRILFLVTQGDLGGAQHYILLLARAFRSRATVGIALPRDGATPSWLSQTLAADGEILRVTVPHLRRAVSPYHDLRALFALRALLTSNAWDIVHANSSKAGVLLGIAAWSLGNKRRTRIVYTAHGWVFLEPLRAVQKFCYQFLERFAAKGRDATIVLCQKERTIAETTLGIRSATLHLIPHDLPRDNTTLLSRAEAQKELGLPHEDVCTIGVIANMYRTKGLDVLLSACEHPILRDLNWRLAIIGDGPERQALEEQRMRLKNKNAVLFAGQRPMAQRLLSAFDLFVLPSRKEGLPFALLEAIAAHLPIIATDVGGVREAVGEAAIVIRPEDPDALVRAIVRLLQNPEERQRLEDATSTQAGQSTGAMIEKTWSVYKSLLSQKREVAL